MTQALTTTNPTGAQGLSLMSRVEEFQQVAKLFAESGMFTDARGAAQCFVRIMAGAELGLPPFTAMNAFHIIQGKPTMAAGTIAARLKASGKYTYKIVEKTAEKCVIDFYEHGEKVWTEVWDVKRAIKAAVKNMDKFPDAMLFSRAISAGARAVAPDIVGQFYTPDELGADVDAEGNIIPSASVPPPTQAPTAAPTPAPAPTQPPPPPTEIVLKPVSDANRAAVSQLLDKRNALAELGTTKGATMTEDEKRAFVAAVSDLAQAVNVQLTLRELQTFKLEGKVSDRFKSINTALNGLMDYDAGAPREGELTVENAQP